MHNRNLIAALLKIFPAEWRSKYGLELSSLLERDPVTPSIVWNVLCSGLYQRVRKPPVWAGAALLLAVWFLLGLTANTMRAMSPENYSLFWKSYLPLELGVGYWMRRRGSSSPGLGTAYAVFIASMPMMALELLRSRNILNPTVLDLQGHVWRSGSGFTEFAYRGVSNRYEFLACVIVVLLSAIVALAAGWLGGQIADAVQAFRRIRISR